MNHHNGQYKPTCAPAKHEVKCEPVCKEPEPVCEPTCEPTSKSKGSAGAAAGWLSLIGVGILFFILVLILIWVADPKELRKYEGDHCSDDRDIVKYIVVAIIAAILGVILVAASGGAAAASIYAMQHANDC